MHPHTGTVSLAVYQAQEGRGIGLPERSEMLGLSYDAPFKKQNPQSVHTQRRNYEESLENSRGNPYPTPEVLPFN